MKLDTGYGYEGYYNILKPIAENLKVMTIDYPQTIIYTKLKYCGFAYRLFDSILGGEQYVDSTRVPSKRLFAQFHSPQTADMKKEILSEIVKENSNIRVIFATSALGMGVNAPFVTQIVHIGPPSSLEAFIQEIGRAGRKGQPSKSFLFYSNSEISDYKINKKLIDKAMADFCKNSSECYREIIMKYFGFQKRQQDSCCSICHPEEISENMASVLSKKNEKKKVRVINNKEKKSLITSFDNILADFDSVADEFDVNLCCFEGEEKMSTDELNDILQTVLIELEYIEHESDLLSKYKIIDETTRIKVFSMIECYTKLI